MRRTAAILALASSIAMIAAAPPGYTESSQTLFLRGEGCGADAAPYLSPTSGADGLDGCGAVAGLPVNEAIHTVDGSIEPDTFATRTTFAGVIIDGTRNVTGQIQAESWFQLGAGGGGQVVVEGRVYGRQGNKTVTLGSFSQEAMVFDTDDEHVFELDIDIDDELALDEFTSISVDVVVRGLNMNHSNLGLEGDSFIELPTLLPVEEPEAAEEA